MSQHARSIAFWISDAIAVIDADSVGLAKAADGNLDATVDGCPAWFVRDLVRPHDPLDARPEHSAAELHGTASDVLLWPYRRIPTADLNVVGDATQLDRLIA